MRILDDIIDGCLVVFLFVWICLAMVIWWIVGDGMPLTLDPYEDWR